MESDAKCSAVSPPAVDQPVSCLPTGQTHLRLPWQPRGGSVQQVNGSTGVILAPVKYLCSPVRATTRVFQVVVVVAFSSRARILGECSTIHSPPALFFFFFKWRLACAHYFLSLRQDQSTVAQRAKTTVAECSLTSYV